MVSYHTPYKRTRLEIGTAVLRMDYGNNNWHMMSVSGAYKSKLSHQLPGAQSGLGELHSMTDVNSLAYATLMKMAIQHQDSEIRIQ